MSQTFLVEITFLPREHFRKTLRSMRERAEFLSLLACGQVRGQRIMGQPEKRIIRGGWLGSSAANLVSSAFALQVGKGRVIGAAAVAFGDFEFFCSC